MTAVEAPAAERCGGVKVVPVEGPKGGRMAARCRGCPDCEPSEAEEARRDEVRRHHAEVMLAEPREIEAHLVRPGDALLCSDDEWHPVLTSFGENTASASATVWAIYCVVEGEPTRRISGDTSDLMTIRRLGAARG